ncbi:MAG TPA: DUF5947 family protein [Chthoniobacterales bacterium]|jgi:hypothetical protein|nr:DUF5947 family protein [Chthoniobacterales bacterium]
MRSSSFATLRRFASAQRTPIAAPRAELEHCELCSVPLGPTHRHLLEMATRRIVCSCDPCALRFENVVGGKFKLIPRDARALPDFQMSDAEWEGLSLPISLAFFFHDTPNEKMAAYYPSPAGATESLLPLTAWEALVVANPVLRDMQADVETLLVNRVEGAREYFLAPIDLCFELVGLIRIHWRGFSGGEDVWREIDGFFARLKGN